MLKSTHKPLQKPGLPQGWSEHQAPTGHTYYYNEITKESTYTRPQDQFLPATLQPFSAFDVNGLNVTSHDQSNPRSTDHATYPFARLQSGWTGDNRARSLGLRRSQSQDRPKTMHSIPGCESWVLVKTRLGRRFVHNLANQESFWKFPPLVIKGVVEYDRLEREKKARVNSEKLTNDEGNRRATEADPLETDVTAPSIALRPVPPVREHSSPLLDSDGEEYEEVEITDDDEDDGNDSKRQKLDDEAADEVVEFNEDDIAYQLAQMGDDYGLDPEEYGDGDDAEIDEDAQGLPLTEQDSSALFKDMLDDHHISPYMTWDKIVEVGEIIEDDRYTVLSSMKSRKEVYSDWSRDKIQQLKTQREKEEKIDPRIPYFALLESKATPKLYWPEFRRKYQKEASMKASNLTDKEREKWYREYTGRLKLPEKSLKADLITLLRATPVYALNHSSRLSALPATLLTDMRFISLRASIRDPLIEAHISSLPLAPTEDQDTRDENTASEKNRRERSRREQALADRQRYVEAQKRKEQGALLQSKHLLQDEEAEIQQAMKVSKTGLKSYLEPAPQAHDKSSN